MSLWTRIQRRICPSCLPDPAETHSAVSALERTAAALKSLRAEIREMREEMAADDNPLLGRKPPRVPRRKQR